MILKFVLVYVANAPSESVAVKTIGPGPKLDVGVPVRYPVVELRVSP